MMPTPRSGTVVPVPATGELAGASLAKHVASNPPAQSPRWLVPPSERYDAYLSFTLDACH